MAICAGIGRLILELLVLPRPAALFKVKLASLEDPYYFLKLGKPLKFEKGPNSLAEHTFSRSDPATSRKCGSRYALRPQFR